MTDEEIETERKKSIELQKKVGLNQKLIKTENSLKMREN